MKRLYMIMMIQLFCVSLLLPAAEQSSIYDKYTVSLNSWINAEINFTQMMNILSDLDKDLSMKTLNWETYYWKSRISLLRGQIYYEQNENLLSIRELEGCLEFAGQANELKERSETLSTMAMANSLLMLQKGFLFLVGNFTVPQQQAENALELDRKNSHAWLIKAQFLCNAPSIVGGNLEEGIRILIDLSKRTDLNTADSFFILQSLAEVYRDNNRKKEAARACRKALSIFPRNIFCGKMLLELEK